MQQHINNIEQSKKTYLDYLFKQYKKGLASRQNIIELQKNGYVKISNSPEEKKYTFPQNEIKDNRDLFEKTKDKVLLNCKENITKEDWLPKSLLKHSAEFRLWIDSMTLGYFPLKAEYKLFNNYKAQALRWMDDFADPNNEENEDVKRELVHREYARCEENTLYFSMKYGLVKEGSTGEGIIRFKPKEHNAVLFYLLDCRYSLILGKPRQIFSSTTIGLFALKKSLFTYNFYTKFISENEKTSQEIFRDKIKYPFGELPLWMQPKVTGESLTSFKLGSKPEKGKFEAPNSIIDVVVPTRTAINGGSPPLILIDEIGNIPIIIEMIAEALPTMYVDKNSDGNLELRRQCVLWGTGVSEDKGSAAYEQLFKWHLKLWQEGKGNIFVPLFFSWHTRCNTKVYLERKSEYYGGDYAEQKNLNIEVTKKMFHQHFPATWMDMFNVTSNTLVSNDIIADGLANIREQFKAGHQLTWGYFEPIFDYTKPYQEEFDIPYAVKGARFIKVDDEDQNLATCAMLLPPDSNWKNRYYQGTDPTTHETGISMFASSIWDKKNKTIAAILNFRKQYDNEYCLLQSMLMGIYYDTENADGDKKGVWELTEANSGTLYTQYKENRGCGKRLVYNTMLPPDQRGGTGRFGIDNRAGIRHIFIINKLKECIENYYKNIYFDVVFEQLRTFIRNDKKQGQSWGSMDKRVYFDDVLFSLAYAYICAEIVFGYVSPLQKEEIKEGKERPMKWKTIRDGDGMQTRVQVYANAR